MEILRVKWSGDRVYVATAVDRRSQCAQLPGICGMEMPLREAVYRVKDGHELWNVSRDDLLTEAQWQKQKKKA
jgi:hypothetical protein